MTSHSWDPSGAGISDNPGYHGPSIVFCVLSATVEEVLATCYGKLSGATVVRLHGASCKSFPGTFQIWLKGKLFRQNSDRAIKSDSHEGSSSFRSHYRVIYGNGNSLAWLLAPLKCDSGTTNY